MTESPPQNARSVARTTIEAARSAWKTASTAWPKKPAPPSSDHLRSPELDTNTFLRSKIDPKFLESHYDIDRSKYSSPYDFYFAEVTEHAISPSPEFSEEGYRAIHEDVAESIREGVYKSGFDHFLSNVGRENRRSLSVVEYDEYKRIREAEQTREILEENIPTITQTQAFDVLADIEFFTENVYVRKLPATPGRGLLVLVPNFLPEVFFGGYSAFFSFLHALKVRTGVEIRLLVVNRTPQDLHRWNIARAKLGEGIESTLFDEISHFLPTRSVEIPGNFDVMSYSAETHYVADVAARAVGRPPIFFIQEFEPDFHAEGDMRTFVHNAFLLRHIAIYNSDELRQYFQEYTNVFARQGAEYQYCTIENSVGGIELDLDAYNELRSAAATKTLVFYGRPEAHAARNHFATFVLGLRMAIRNGVFDEGSWEFVSIGSLAHEGSFPIVGPHHLKIVTKAPFAEYVALLQSADVGASFISTPHPGIVHFQMAAFGLPTVTNTTPIRSQAWLRACNENLIGVELTPASIAEGLELAVARSQDFQARFEAARRAKTVGKTEAVRNALEFLEKVIDLPSIAGHRAS